MSEAARYVWVHIIMGVLVLHWIWGWVWMMTVWIVPMTLAVATPVFGYPPLAFILIAVGVAVPTFLSFIPVVLLTALTFKLLGVWHRW